jgi:phosphoserine aminotransferase
MEKLKAAIDRSAKLLGVPENYRIFIVPASDTGAVELAMWSLLGSRIVDAFVWDTFGAEWMTDSVNQLRLDTRVHRAEFGELPDLAKADPTHDAIFVWNGTTSGVCAPDAEWISDNREGLTICDATSAVFAMDLPWPKLDVTAFSWQKGVGSEAAHGMLVLSPRAIKRFETYTPPWPLPKIFRVKKDGKFNAGLFQGETLNTPSMLAVEDYLDALDWAESIGGLPALLARTEKNFAALSRWVESCKWLNFMAADKRSRSPASVCLKITEPWFQDLAPTDQRLIVKEFADQLEREGVAFDVAGHRTAPPGLRVWCGPTVESEEIEAFTPWLDWAWKEMRPAKKT